MPTTSLTVSGTVTGLVEGSNTLSFSYSNTSAPGLREVFTFTNAAGTTMQDISPATVIPNATGTTSYIVIVPPSTNTINLTLAGTDSTANAMTLHPTSPVVLPYPTSGTVRIFLGFLSAPATTQNIQVYYL